MSDIDDCLVPVVRSCVVCVHSLLYADGHGTLKDAADDRMSLAVPDPR